MLSAAEVAAMRSVQAQALPDTCTISRKSSSSDGRGGQTVSYTPYATGVPCRLGRAGSGSGSETIDAEKVQQKTPWVVTFEYDQDVRNTDCIVVGTRTFEVVNGEPHEAWTTALRVQVEEVT